MEEQFVNFRNAFYNGINYKFSENLFFGLSSLNQVAGRLPNPINVFIKSDVGIYGGYLKIIPFYGINFDGECAINYNTLTSSYGIGISKIFDGKSSKFKVGYERYWIEDNFFQAKILTIIYIIELLLCPTNLALGFFLIILSDLSMEKILK